MKKLIYFVLVTLVIALVGCAAQPVSGDVIKSDKPRNTSPVVDKADMDSLVNGNNTFNFDLYQALRKTDGNIFYSPYSISEALAMTYAGARGDTEKAIADALEFSLSQERLHPAFNKLDLELKKRGQGAQGKDAKGFRLNVVNAIWGQKDFSFQSQFLDTLAINYGAGLRILDFITQTEKSRVTINDWVADQTENRIKDLIPQGVITNMTRLVLTNAIYFNAAWMYPFKTENTSNGAFHLLNGSNVTMPMMKQTQSFRYAEGANYQAVELPYDGNELSMIILLPKEGQIEAFEKALNGETYKEIVNKLGTRSVTLTMPKFEYESSFGLKQALTDLGMGVAFNPDTADLSGISGKRDLYIQDVIHKAFVSVDEAGTEAAAATAVIVGTTSAPQPATMTIDRPFIFVIRDIATGSTIFTGRVMNPVVK